MEHVGVNNKGFPKGDIRNFGDGSRTTEIPEFAASKMKEESFGLSRADRMRMVRTKMTQSRKKLEHRPVEKILELVRHQKRAKTLRGERIVQASEVDNDIVQDNDSNNVIVGADVEGLYPALDDRA